MLISCPSCPKVYQVPASSIPPEGREVSCASCGTIWFENAQDDSHCSSAAIEELAAAEEQLHADLDDNIIDWAAEIEDRQFQHIQIEDKRTIAAPIIEDVIDLDGDELLEEHEVVEPVTAAAFSASADQQAPRGRETLAPIEPIAPSRSLVRKAGLALIHVRDIWRGLRGDAGAARPVNPGQNAANRFRQAARRRELNRLTPVRAFGWALWSTSCLALLLLVGVFHQEAKAFWPRIERVYAWLDGSEGETPLVIRDIQQRYAQSLDSNVLELRGIVVNHGDAPLVPDLEIAAMVKNKAHNMHVAISDVPLPSGGERPFFIRVALPDGTEKAILQVGAPKERVLLSETTAHKAGAGSGYRMQRQGSGWDDVPTSPSLSAR